MPKKLFPDSLINEFARGRCVLFLGAGISATAMSDNGKHPPDWNKFINGAITLIKSKKIQKEASRYLRAGSNTLALQSIINASSRADYLEYVEQHFNNPQYKPSKVHATIAELGAKIVITTNFDLIFDNYCRNVAGQGFKIITYDNESLPDALRSDASLIIKAHGTIDNPQNMIFSKADYHRAKKYFGRFYEILKAIFITNTIIFLGCGMADPDLLEILEEEKITSTQEKPHYLLTTSGQSETQKKDLLDSYNVETLVYGRNHSDLLPKLEELKDLIFERRSELGIH